MQHFVRSQAWDLVSKCNPSFSAFISLSATHMISVILFVAENDQHNVAVIQDSIVIVSNTVSNFKHTLHVIATDPVLCVKKEFFVRHYFSPPVFELETVCFIYSSFETSGRASIV